MKELHITKVAGDIVRAEDVPSVLDNYGIMFQKIDCANWVDYPYVPDVCFRIAHTGKEILLHFKVTEDSIRAVANHDNGRVWEDSCVEFFVQTDETKPEYYNIECNCTGTLLVGHGVIGHRIHALPAVLESVKRWSSLGGMGIFEERVGECSWELSEIIPVSAFFKDNVQVLDGKIWKGNFYKCGDLLQKSHFLSWNLINLPKPCFHCPDFFGRLMFE